MRVGLGCMRVDDARAVEVIRAAWDAGVRHFDTAHAYGNQHLLRVALDGREASITSKGGMARPDGKWVPDGRAATLRAHALETVEALGRPPDVFLIHAPDSRVAWPVTVRALSKLKAEGVVRAVGVSNVNLTQLDQSLEVVELAEVQVALSVLDDSAVRSGVVARCVERGLALVAHSPLGGLKQVERLLRHPVLAALSARLGASPAAVALAALLDLGEVVRVIPGARRVETARDLARAATLQLDEPARTALRAAFPALAPLASRGAARASSSRQKVDGEVVLVMGLQGSGKSARVGPYLERGYLRLNRDELRCTLDEVTKRAAQALASGRTRLVLDNTSLTRAARAAIIDVASSAGVPVRGQWLEVPLHEAQVNVIWRMLDAHGRLLGPTELGKGDDNTRLPPVAQLRMLKTLEVPTLDEGFDALEVVPFVRVPRPGVPAIFAAEGLEVPGAVTFAWRPEGEGGAAALVCPHPAGAPTCWCRPPLPGLLLLYAHRHGVDLAKSELHGVTETHQVLAAIVGARFVQH
jgi:aryl-alcohol dehydrogenase-like predicted oxidoreductase